MAKIVLENPGRALEIGANVGTAFESRSPKAALTTLPEVINFYHTVEELYTGNLVQYENFVSPVPINASPIIK